MSYEAKDTWCIYKHTLKNTELSYIGQTNNIKARWKPSAYKGCRKFYQAIKTYGWDNFTHEVLVDNLTLDEANQLETFFINKFNSIEHGFNLNTGGDNKLASQETKEKMSKTRLGVPKTESHKKAISNALKGYKQSEIHKANNRRAQHRKPVQCIETGKKYDSLAEAERQTGILAETISRQIRGKQKSTQGLHWRFINEL